MTGKELSARLFGRNAKPDWGLVLGTGFDAWLEHLSPGNKVPFPEIEGLTETTVPGHKGFFAAGSVAGAPVAVVVGRFHLYEGLSASQIVKPVNLLRSMGVGSVLLTAAVGSVRSGVEPGEALVIEDQINLTGEDPHTATGKFPDPAALYDPLLVQRLAEAGLKKGVLAGVRGPSYETPAEVRAIKTLGADVVCMSTVLEALALAGTGVKCAGLVVVANRAGSPGTNHEDVLKCARAAAERLWPAVSAFMGRAAD